MVPEAKARIEALREAARVGLADVEAGRFRTFRTPRQVSRHFGAMADEVIAAALTGKTTR